jgi:hypothetical protein
LPNLRHPCRPSAELADFELIFLDSLCQLDATDHYRCGPKALQTQHRAQPLLDSPMVLFNGLITNDKFCLIRVIRQKLHYVRRRRALPCQVTDSCEYPRDEGHRGGANEATVECSSSVSTDQGCAAAVGSSLPTSAGMDPTEQTGIRPTAFVSPSSRNGGEM